MTKYTEEEVIKEALSFFNGDELAADVFTKYALSDSDNNYYEKSPLDTFNRLATEFSRIEAKYQAPLSRQEIYDYLVGMTIIAQGSPMAAIGNPFQLQSASNCFVIENTVDSYGGIFLTDQQQVQIMKRRGGVGNDISGIRPKGMPTSNGAKTTDGIGVFMERFSNSTREVAQNGRRGARMITISVHHPEILTFIRIKRDLQKITGANISVRATDEFMRAVRDGADYQQRWPVDSDKPLITKAVSANEIFEEIAQCAWECADPGMLFWDSVIRECPADCYPRYRSISTNPCQPGWATVLTPSGIRTFDEIDVGSTIWTGQQWARVSNKVQTGVKRVNGYVTRAGVFYGTENHRVVQNGVKIEVRDAKSIDSSPLPSSGDILASTQRSFEITTMEDCGEHPVFDITVDAPEHTYWTGGLLVSNCGELNLSANDSCRLILINFKKFVRNPFTNKAYFDYETHAKAARVGQRLMDDLVDIELEQIDKILAKIEQDPEPDLIKQVEKDLWVKIREACQNGRRTGLGATGVGDAVAALGIKYGSRESIDAVSLMYENQARAAYKESVQLAKERGAFPEFNRDLEAGHPFLDRVGVYENPDYVKYGRRNISCLTTSPAGSVSCLAQTTSGIEPAIFLSYMRKRKVVAGDPSATYVDEHGDHWQKYQVYHLGHQEWQLANPDKPETESPYWGCTAEDINPMDKIKLQAAAQLWVDHAISNTINLPNTATKEDVANAYLFGWKAGCKGITVYRAGSRNSVISKTDDTVKKTNTIVETNAPKRPAELPCDIHRSRIKGDEYTILVGLLNGKPYEVFAGLTSNIELPKNEETGTLTKKARSYDLTLKNGTEYKDVVSLFDNPNHGAFTRTLSTALRHGVPVRYLVEQLRKDKHSDLYSFSTVMARVLAKHYIQDGVEAGKCPECGEKALKYIQGCPMCQECGYSKCG